MRMISTSPKPMSAGASRRRSAAFIDQSVALAALPRGHSPILLKRASATRLALPNNINFTPTTPQSPKFGVEPEIGGERGIRTLGKVLKPYNGLANRPFRPLRHLSG
jgi:hypothetical protein